MLFQHIEALDKYDTSAPHQDAVTSTATDTDITTTDTTEEDKREAWRQARLQSIEEDALQAQMVIDKMSDTGEIYLGIVKRFLLIGTIFHSHH